MLAARPGNSRSATRLTAVPSPLDLIADWPVPAASAAVVGRSGVLAEYGDPAPGTGWPR